MKNFNRGGRQSGGGKRFGGDGRRDFNKSSMHSAICDECGRECEVPFRPTGDKPIYCNECFQLKRDGGSGKRDFRKPSFEDKKRYTVICSKCGKSCEVPFKPTEGKLVYCDECFRKRGAAKKETGVSKEQFEALNSKLDKIIKLLTPATSSETTQKVQEATKEVKNTKSKKKTMKVSEEKPATKKVEAKKNAPKKPAAKKAAASKVPAKNPATKKKK